MDPADRDAGCSEVADAGSHHVPAKTVKTMQTQPTPRAAHESPCGPALPSVLPRCYGHKKDSGWRPNGQR